MSIAQLTVETTKDRINQGKILSQFEGKERTNMARVMHVPNSSSITDYVQVWKFFGPENSDYNFEVVLRTPWSALINLARSKKDLTIRLLITELVLAGVEAEWNNTDCPYSFPPDGKAIGAVLGHPGLYLEDAQILVAKLHHWQDKPLTDQESALVDLPMPDLYSKVKDHMNPGTPEKADKIELHLQEINAAAAAAIEKVDTGIAELEVSNANSNASLVQLLGAFMSEVRNFMEANFAHMETTSQFMGETRQHTDDSRQFMLDVREFMAQFNDTDKVVVMGQQAIIDALRASNRQYEVELNEAEKIIADLKAVTAEQAKQIKDVQDGFAMLTSFIPAPKTVDASPNGENA